MPDVVSPEAAERGKHDREARHRALLDAATAVFAERGYDAATTREIAARACCAEGLIHRYFGGKRGLLAGILQSKARHLIEHAPAEVPDRESVAEEVAQLLRHALDVMWQHREFMRVAIAQGVIDPTLGHTVCAELNRERARLVREKLARHKAAGRIRADADIDAAAEAIAWLGFDLGFMMQVASGLARDRARDLADRAAEIIVRGLAPSEHPDPSTGVPHDGAIHQTD
jgi:AcrR family transcriptional regulator